MPPKYWKLEYNKNKKAPKNHAYARHVCRSWYNGSYTIMMAKPMKTLKLHILMIQFLIAFDKGERLHSAVAFENFGAFIDTDLAPPKNSSGVKLFGKMT